MATQKFNYKIGDKKITLTRMASLPMGVFRKSRGLPEMEQSFMALEAAADDKTLEIIDGLTSEQFGKMLDAWAKDADVNVGE